MEPTAQPASRAVTPSAGLGPGAVAAGWLGLLPFALALACVALGPTPDWRHFGLELALVWGAVIL